MHKVRQPHFDRGTGGCMCVRLWLCSAVTLVCSHGGMWGNSTLEARGGAGGLSTFDVSTVCLEEKEKSCTSHRTTLHAQSVSHCRIM